MSTGLNCQMLKNPKTGEWFYVLQSFSCPAFANDWRDYSRATGPFASEAEADEHLGKNEANPGGYTIVTPAELGKTYEDLIAGARDPYPSRESYADRCARTGRGNYFDRGW